MKNINVVVKKESFGCQIFDKLYAYTQAQNQNFQSNLNISFSDTPKEQYINVLYCYMPDLLTDIEKYDCVILDNADEPIGMVNTDTMINALDAKNVYVQANSIFHANKNFDTNKIIRLHGDIENFNDYYTRPFYPQYYQQIEYKKQKTVCFINGQNRAHRNHFLQLVKMQNCDIDVFNNLSNIVYETNDSNLESSADSEFREFVNESYEITRNAYSPYYDNSISCGIDNKMGKVPLGYFLAPCYNKYRVVAFPESTWLNDELSVSEKALKCFMSKCLPFPVAGRHTNTLYNSLGFYTAWDILPGKLKQFDYEEDHQNRYKMMVDALQWINENVYTCDQFDFYVEQNYNNYLNTKLSTVGVKKFYKVLNAL